MTLLIFTTKTDISRHRLLQEGTKANCDSKLVYFEELSVVNNTLLHNLETLPITSSDRILIRWPFNADDTAIEYNVFVHFILMHYGDLVVFDRKCLREFSPYYEDKLFQALLFNKLKIPTPQTGYFLSYEKLEESTILFPLVLKKRVSSRSKNNFLVTSKEDLKKKLETRDIRDYVFQEVIDIDKDMRVLTLKDEVMGVVRRFTHTRDDNRLAVKGRENIENVPSEIYDYTQTIQKNLGADFVGFDVLLDKSGSYYFIEANLSPQFDKFEEATGVNVAKKVIQIAQGL